jgi:hypothetical protein
MAQIAARRAALRGAALAAGAGLLWLGFSTAADTATIHGSPRANVIYGTKGPDTLYGGAGNDLLYGGAGNDRLYGGAGNDKLYGGAGNDRLYGGPGNDVLVGGPGRDTISCGKGSDIVYSDGHDRIASDCEAILGPSVKPPPLPPKPGSTTTSVVRTTTFVTTSTSSQVTTVNTPAPPPPTTAPVPTTAPLPTTTTAQSPCGQGPQSYRYSLVNEPLATSSVSVAETIDALPSYPETGDHALAYVAVAYGRTANGCAALGWLQGGIWRGATLYSPDSGTAFLYVEWQTASSYQLIRLSDVAVPSTHTFTISSSGPNNTWGIWIDGKFIASVQLDQAPSTFSTAAEDYSVGGVVWPSFDWTFSNASPPFAQAPTGQLPSDSFTGTGWHTALH